MNNIILLIRLNDASNNEKELFNNSIEEYYLDRGFHREKISELIIFTRDKEKVIIEHAKLENTNNYLYNIFYDEKFIKRKFLKEVFFNEYVVDSKIIFDSGSNALVGKYHENISKIENLMKYYLGARIADNQGIKVFDIVKNFKVKEYLGERNNKMITSLQRLELNNIFEYIKSNPLGGDEINILRGLSEEVFEESNSDRLSEVTDKIRSKIEENIFDKLKKELIEFGMMDCLYEWRNIISHNSCVETNEFEKLGVKITELSKKIEKICIENQDDKRYIDTINMLPNISTLILSDKTKVSIMLRLIEAINKLFNDSLLDELNCKNKVKNNNDSLIFNGENVKIIIADVEPEIDLCTFSECNIYKISIYFESNDKYIDINEIIYGVFNDIVYKYIVLYDSISDSLCNILYKYINKVENMVRFYVKISEALLIKENSKKIKQKNIDKANMRLALDLNALNINININEKKIDLINNDLYTVDFIDLLEKLSNPLNDIKYSEIMEKETFKNQRDFNRSIADLAKMDDNIDSIKDKWKELYRIRTMVAHNYILSYKQYKEFENLYIETSEEIEEAIFKLLKGNINNFNLDYSIIKNNTCLSIKEVLGRYKIEFVKDECIEFSCYIATHSIWKVINMIFDLNLEDETFFLTENLIKVLCSIEIDSITNELIESKLDEIIKYYRCNISDKSKNYRLLEEAISNSLKEIAELMK